MRKTFWSLAMLMAVPAFAQTGPTRVATNNPAAAWKGATRTKTASPGARIKPEIPLDSPIITLKGVCGQRPANAKTKASSECKTVVTRGQLDALVALIDPEAQLKARQQFALTYARLLAATQLAEQKKMDQNPAISREIQLEVKLARMQVLTNSLLQSMQRQSQRISDQDVEDYYKKNEQSFAQATVHRLVIPLSAATDAGKPVDAAAAKTLMEDLRERALKGEEFDELQARAYKELGIKEPIPPTTITVERRQAHTPEETKIFDLDMGETSAVLESRNAFWILRLEGKRTMTLQQVKPQIEASLGLQRIEDGVNRVFDGISAEFNLKYMDAKTQPELIPPAVVVQAGAGGRRGGSSVMRQP
jgi:PPIC-type PPIASE domain